MLALFAGMSLVLALTGLYALAAHRVAQRRHELALRAAVGASPMRLMVDVIREASHLVAVAILLSAIGTVASGPLLQGLIVGIPALETRTFAWTTVLVASVTLAATMLAARRVPARGLSRAHVAADLPPPLRFGEIAHSLAEGG
jgi:putative ABC transport system permease protein